MNNLKAIKHVALDMDGTIYLGDTLFPFTLPFLELLDKNGISYSFLTNNPSKSKQAYLEKLAKYGVPCREDQMYSTADATIAYIKDKYPSLKRLFVLGTPSMTAQFAEAGFEFTADDPDDVPDAIVAAFDKTLEYRRLCRFCWWASQKKDDKYAIPFIATNPDWVCPTDKPIILVDCGSICACIEAATGRKPDLFIGKPNPDILNGVLSSKGIEPHELAMVGDRLYTDVQTALNAGSLGVLVLSGETTAQMAKNADPRVLVCRDLEEFGELLVKSH